MIRPALKGRFLSKTMMLAAVFVVASGFFYVPQAHATFSETVTSAGQTFSVDWHYNSNTSSGGDLSAPLNAIGTFTVQSLSSTTLDLAATIDNTTALNSSLTQAYLMSLGISTSPSATTTLLNAGNIFTQADTPSTGNFPGGFKNIDACVYATGNSCNGTDINNGLAAGSSDSFVLALSGNFKSSPAITLSDFAVKFQTNEGSYEFGGNSLSETPEPKTLLLFGTALLLAVGPALRRRLLPALSEVRRG